VTLLSLLFFYEMLLLVTQRSLPYGNMENCSNFPI